MVANQPALPPPAAAPANIPLATDALVASRMVRLRAAMSTQRRRTVAWHEVLELLLDVYDEIEGSGR